MKNKTYKNSTPKLKHDSSKSMRAGQRRLPPPNKPVASITAEVRRPGLSGRLQLLGVPKEVIDVILNTTYTVNKLELPLFGLTQEASGEWQYRHQEVIEAVNIYETMRNRLASDGQRRLDTEVFVEFDQYIKSLALNRTKKTLADVLVTDDTIFESPQLLDMRRQEMLKDTLLNRKKVPIKGVKCGRCKADEAFQSEKQLRSGDEGATWINECAKCGNKWNA